jgi:CubicO group peptidase (beta-lactamase class C family)
MTRIRKPVAVVAMLIGLVAARLLGQQSQTPMISTAPVLPLLESYLESLRQQSGIPGMSGVLVRDRVVAWSKGFGYADVTARIAATPDTPYLAGDISEVFASTLVLQCVEQRHLFLDDPISSLGLTQPEPDATPRGLLSHAAPPGAPAPFVFSPDRFSHLTEVMEACAPQPYRKSIAHRILDAAVMMDSAPGTDLADPNLTLPEGLFEQSDLDRYRQVLSRMAPPYRVDSKKRATRNTDLLPMTATAANGLVTTAMDLAKFDAALTPLDGDDRSALLLPDTLNLAWTNAVSRTGTTLPTGLGWFVQTYNGEKLVWMFSNVPNAYSAIVVKMPNRGVTFILLANSDGLSSPFQLAQGDVTKSLFASVFLKLFSS